MSAQREPRTLSKESSNRIPASSASSLNTPHQGSADGNVAMTKKIPKKAVPPRPSPQMGVTAAPPRIPDKLRSSRMFDENQLQQKKKQIRQNLFEMIDHESDSYSVLSKLKSSGEAAKFHRIPAVVHESPKYSATTDYEFEFQGNHDVARVSMALDAVKQYIDDSVPVEDDASSYISLDNDFMDGDDLSPVPTSPIAQSMDDIPETPASPPPMQIPRSSTMPEIPDFDVDEDMLELSTKLFMKTGAGLQSAQKPPPITTSTVGPPAATLVHSSSTPATPMAGPVNVSKKVQLVKVSLDQVDRSKTSTKAKKDQYESKTAGVRKTIKRKDIAEVFDLSLPAPSSTQSSVSTSDSPQAAPEPRVEVPSENPPKPAELESSTIEVKDILEEKLDSKVGLTKAVSEVSMDYLVNENKSQSKESSEMEVLVRKAVELCLLNAKMSEMVPEAMKVVHDKKSYPVENLANPQFTRIRKIFQVSENDIVDSICRHGNLIGGISKGKSGQYFFATPDRRFVLKTLTKEEFDFLQSSFVLEYASYMAKHKNSLLPRFYACIKIQYGLIPSTYRFVIMNNVFCSDLKMHEVYDLKGSKVGRQASKDEPNILKDNDLVKRKRQFYFSSELLLGLYLQLTEDVRFLSEHKIMDYSLLIGIHIIDENSPLNSPDYKESEEGDDTYRSMFQKENGGMIARSKDDEPLAEIYYMGLIDVLQEYNLWKNLETKFRTIRHDQHAISAVDPEQYSNRFLGYVFKNVIKFDSSRKLPM